MHLACRLGLRCREVREDQWGTCHNTWEDLHLGWEYKEWDRKDNHLYLWEGQDYHLYLWEGLDNHLYLWEDLGWEALKVPHRWEDQANR